METKDKKQRWCSSCPMEDLESWGRYLFGLCQGAVGGTCCPEYQPSCVRAVELQRESLGVALLGQLTVVSLRLVTGHFSGGCVAMVVFALGNRARCSMQASRLSAYVAFTFSLAALDAADLVNNVGNLGLGFLALPFQDHLSQNLSAASMLIAPISEVCGGFAAWECLSRPSALFFSTQDDASQPAYRHAALPPSGRLSGQLYARGAGGWMPQPRGGLSSRDGYWAAEGLLPGARPAPVAWPEEDDEELWGRRAAVRDVASSSRGIAWQRKARSLEPWCSECGVDIGDGEGWSGTGSFRDKVFCSRCWATWTQAARIG